MQNNIDERERKRERERERDREKKKFIKGWRGAKERNALTIKMLAKTAKNCKKKIKSG